MQLEVAPPERADAVMLGLCHDLHLSWADSQWVALTMRLGIPLVTADMRLVRAVPPHIAWMESLGNVPV